MKYKYVVEEVNKLRKVLKWIILICSVLLIYFTVIIIEFTLLSIYGIIGIIIGLVIIGIIGLSSLVYVFTRMFPKEKEIATYYTGGLLRRNVIAGAVIVMALYYIFLNLVGIIELPILPILLGLPIEYWFLIEVILIFLILGLLFFVVTPYGLKLPNGKESMKQYTYSIGFTRTKPLARNILLGLVSFLLYALSSWFFANILGTYIFDPNVLFGYPNWVFLYYMLYAGIWEEIAFRGVILNLQLRKYSKMTSIITNGIFFGIFHFLNILIGFDPLYIINQVFFACCLGIALAYIYVKTESLLPCMMIHYLVNSFGQLFVNATFPNNAIASAFVVYGLGLVPMILILLLTKLLVRKRK